MSEQKEKSKTQEELQAEAKAIAEARGKEWEEFMNGLKENPDEPVTKGELVQAIEFISEDMAGLSQMLGITAQNTQVLHHNFQQLAQVLQGGGPGPNGGGRQTPGGIILPH